MTELLAPAGSFKIALRALYTGADAVFTSTQNYGARAYAKNLTIEELEILVKIANILNKKIYITVNTILKDNELEDCYKYLDLLAKIGVHGIIATDFSIINYIICNLPKVECHISTQVGVKNIHDALFFQNIKAKRVVIARESNISDIKEIKNKLDIEVEVFVHGALCVSYSGNCYMSSLLTLRSGNRGRCSQNCRFFYNLLKDDKIVSPKENILAMKDLNAFDSINELKKIGVDSLKIEGRMKNEEYVYSVIDSYRKKLDDKDYKTDRLDKIFHRKYTKGYLNNEDNINIVYTKRSGNIGEYLGNIKYYKNNLYIIDLINDLNINDRIRVSSESKDYYFNVNKLYKLDNNKVNNTKKGYLELPEIIKDINKIYRIKDDNLDINNDTTYFQMLDIYINASLNNKLELICLYKDKVITLYTENLLVKAENSKLTSDVIYDKINKFDIYPLYINNFYANIEDNLFIQLKELNNLRRNLINKILELESISNYSFSINTNYKKFNFINNKEIICKCNTLEQVKACKELNINIIYYKDNIIEYNSTDFNRDNLNLLVKNYGALNNIKNKNITLDYEFNVSNADALYNFYNIGVKNITISKELSKTEIIDLYNNYYNKYKEYPNLDMIIYGHMTLMTMKYCPIKKYGYCPQCKDNQFYLKDDYTKFPIITTNNCLVRILNNNPLNLIDEISNLKPYINHFRLDFTIENYKDTLDILNKALNSFNNNISNSFDNKNHTKGYYKRKIL